MAEKDNVTKFPNGEGVLPSKKVLEDHKAKVAKIDAEMSELKGDKGSLIKNADNDHNVHKKAFKDIMKMLNMEDNKRSTYLAHLDHYRKILNVDGTHNLPLGDIADGNT